VVLGYPNALITQAFSVLSKRAGIFERRAAIESLPNTP